MVDGFFSHFYTSFLSLHLFSSPFSLFSLLLQPSSPARRVDGGGGGGAAAANAFFFIFFALSLLHLPLYTFPDLKSPNTNDMGLDLNEKERRKVILFLVIFGAVFMLVYGSVMMWCLEYGSVLCDVLL